MRFSHFFVDRPIFAAVISVIVTLVGYISFRALPVAEYPEIAPPTVVVSATFAGASAEVIGQTVASPIEQEINGVDNMIYMVSQATGNGALSINVVFKPETNIDQAQVLVQNRVSVALPRLPEAVQRIGVTVRKSSPDLMLVIHLISPDGSLDQQYISNYATVNVRDVITRVDGVGDTIVFGARDYSMRIWLDPAKVQARRLTASDVVAALRAANVQVAAGAVNQPPARSPGGFEIAVQTLGRLSDPEQFADIVVATDDDGRVTRIRDIARVELGSQDYTTNAYLDNKAATAIGIYQRPGSNRIAAANLPAGFGFEWTEIALQEKIAGNTAAVAFSLAVVFVFLLLAAQYESIVLPLAVILIVPMCLFAAVSGILVRGMDNNILTQIGFVVLIGLAAKNAILIVEFARQAEEHGASRQDAAVQAARTRLRPILMTSFAFIFGVLPLVLATGAGAEMRQALGTAVFFGMLGATLFGLLFTPVFYVLVRAMVGGRKRRLPAQPSRAAGSQARE